MIYNVEAEQGLLGCLLSNNLLFDKIQEVVSVEDFYEQQNAEIFYAISEKIKSGKTADPMTLKGVTKDDSYLVTLVISSFSTLNVREYAEVIHDLACRRRLLEVGELISTSAQDMCVDESIKDKVESAEKKLFDIAEKTTDQRGFVSFGESLKESIQTANMAFNNDGKLIGITTGLTDVDNKLGGLQNSDLIVLAARPAMGKSALSTNIAVSCAKTGVGCALFSLEMSSEQITTRILGDQTSVSPDLIRRGKIKPEDFVSFSNAENEIGSIPLYIDDTAGLTISALTTRARRLQRTHGPIGLIVVDYIQLLTSRNLQNRVQEVSEISRGLKVLAKDLNVPVLALSQLSRSVEQREDKRPMLSDLRESGSIEQDADIVMFLYREEYYLSRAEPQRRDNESESQYNERYNRWMERMSETKNLAELIVSKNRHGTIGTVPLMFDAQYTRFKNLAM